MATKDDLIRFRIPAHEKALMDRVAREQGIRLSEFLRRVGREEAERYLAEEGERDSQRAERRLVMRQGVPFHRCPPKGMYCKFCNKIT